ncbi:hypothetical protein F5884DRAFT_786548 [Xylogone sp. PMI_703]|nr:hypothetical protein F5884DRAFT_786548 [Xylogone sp. PMI_703]
MSDPEPRRRRPPLSCTLCRSRKIRYDRGAPCRNCLRSRNGICIYENRSSQPPLPHLSQVEESEKNHYSTPVSHRSTASTVLGGLSNASEPGPTSASIATNPQSSRDVESLKSRIEHLEKELSSATQRLNQSPLQTSDFPADTTTRRYEEAFSIYETRMYGQSHWFNGVELFRDLLKGIEPYLLEESSKAFFGMQRCKSLGKIIKSQRTPAWPLLSKIDLPPKDVADELVACYLRTTESIYRILHIPSFRRDYDSIWEPDSRQDASFMIQLKLVLALGAITYDEHFSLRTSAVHWIYEAQNWVSKPEFKSRLNIQSLQIHILLLLAREAVNVGGELIWITVGALFRTAVYMGYHRDPVHLSKTTFAAEMHRRLWNTILEISLQSSLISGGPPFVSLSGFDTAPPQNLNDDQLAANDAVPEAENRFTPMSIAIALRKTFPSRLAIAKYLNDLGPNGSYEETLRLDASLKESYKTLRQTIQAYKSGPGPSPSAFEIRVTDLLMNHCLLALHTPFLSLALPTTYAFSKKAVIEASLKIWCAVHPSSINAIQSSVIISSERDDLARFAICSSGLFRTVAYQASLLIAVECKTQIQEEESAGPVPLKPDLVSLLEDTKSWCWKCIEAGETNIKCYLLTSILVARIKGLMQGIENDEFPDLLLKAAEEAEERCLSSLKERAADGQIDGTIDGVDEASLNIPPELLEDWDSVTTDTLFDLGNGEPMSWLFNNGATHELY